MAVKSDAEVAAAGGAVPAAVMTTPHFPFFEEAITLLS
jgi:hypothetical protein